MKLYIKNMVCSRCKMVVESELEKLGLTPISVELGEVEIKEVLNDAKKSKLSKILQYYGFELLGNKTSITIERIKNLIVELIQNQKNELKINLSSHIAQQLSQDYNSLSSLFSEVEGITIERYYITLKIEKVKELLIYDELTLSEIAFQLNYSSVSYLSNQFKKITGLTPSYFKQIKEKKRRQIEDV